jgi:hypothetical protein
MDGPGNMRMKSSITASLVSQVIGNMGLFDVCDRLSKWGWNVMPTARNSRGIDIVMYRQGASRTHTIQVKTLSKRHRVPLSGTLDRLLGDFFVICRHIVTDSPECFVLRPDDVRVRAHRGEKDGRISDWRQPKDYAVNEFRDAWEHIGSGLTVAPGTVQQPAAADGTLLRR